MMSEGNSADVGKSCDGTEALSDQLTDIKSGVLIHSGYSPTDAKCRSETMETQMNQNKHKRSFVSAPCLTLH
jgi:hypothetical protein